jgi:two-component system, OmpR family, sensor histidine kinase SenX3
MLVPMKLLSRHIILRIGVVSALGAVLITLAVLQYRWSGEVSEAERERMQGSLNASVSQFRQEFNRELQQLAAAFQPDTNVILNRDWNRYARNASDLLNGTERPLVRTVYFWIADSKSSPVLLKLVPSTKTFAPESWPPQFEILRQRYEVSYASSQRMPPDGRPFAWTVAAGIPLLLHPVMAFAPQGAPNNEGAKFLGLILIELNLDYMLQEFLPELSQRYFGGPDGFVYQVGILSGGSNGPAIYQSDPSEPATVWASADARIPLLDEPRGRMGRRGSGPEIEMRPMGKGDPRPLFGPAGRGMARGGVVVLSGNDGSDWELAVKHRQGSLEEVVAGTRRRNLAISFGILVLLGSSMALIVAYAQRAQRLAQLQMQFVAGVSHELRTPLAVICSAGDNLAAGVAADSNSQVQEYGKLIRDEGWKLSGMVAQVLEFASLQKGRRQYSLSPSPIDEITESTVEKALPLIEAAGFELEKGFHCGTTLVNVDVRALSQCIHNLISNALKYSGESRWISVRTERLQRKQGWEVVIAVQDHGMGIGPEDLPHIFDPFYRGRAVVAAQIHGTGLGLCMTREAVKAMGGNLSVSSEQGKGSTFKIHLPAMPAEAEAAAAENNGG